MKSALQVRVRGMREVALRDCLLRYGRDHLTGDATMAQFEAQLRSSTNPQTTDPFAPPSQADLPSLVSVVEFAAGAIAGGVLYDMVKASAGRIAARHGVKIEIIDLGEKRTEVILPPAKSDAAPDEPAKPDDAAGTKPEREK